MVFPGAEAMAYLPGGKIERASQRGFCILPWRHDFLLAPLGPPRGTDFGQQRDIECISKDHDRTRWHALGMQAHPTQALDPLRVVIFGGQRGPFPHPAHGMEPAADGPGGNLQAVFRLEVGSQRGTTPPRPAPAIGPRGSLEEGPQRALHPGHQGRRPAGDHALALCIDCAAELQSAIEAHKTGDTGARAEQEGRDVGGMTASGTAQSHMESEEVPRAGAAERGEHLGLRCFRDIQ